MGAYNGGAKNGGVDWKYFEKFEAINNRYLPEWGEGKTAATQIVTVINKLIYKWYNDGDVFDNTYHLKGWMNDISSYANWLAEYAGGLGILKQIKDCKTHADYEQLLKSLADKYLDEVYLEKLNHVSKIGSVYDCDGLFQYVEVDEDEDDWEDEDDDE